MSNLKELRKKLGLSEVNFGALIGTSRGALSRGIPKNGHRRNTTVLYWLIGDDPDCIVPRMLKYWLHDTPRSRDSAHRLLRIARKYITPASEFRIWEDAFRQANPDYFPSIRRSSVNKTKSVVPSTEARE